MTDIFAQALAHTAFWEKGVANHKRDPGGLTNMGLTQKLYEKVRQKYPQMRLWPESVLSVTQNQVDEVFRLEFWLACHCNELPAALALPIFDAAVNSGAGDARRWLQQALRVKVDGWLGAITIETARKCDLKVALWELHSLRAWHYMLEDDIDDDFGLGWARRVFDTHNVAMSLIPATGAPP